MPAAETTNAAKTIDIRAFPVRCDVTEALNHPMLPALHLAARHAA